MMERSTKKAIPATQVLIFTVFGDSEQVFRALEAGASGYLLKRTPRSEMVEAIKQVWDGGAPMSGEVARKVVESFRKTPPAKSADSSTSSNASDRRSHFNPPRDPKRHFPSDTARHVADSHDCHARCQTPFTTFATSAVALGRAELQLAEDTVKVFDIDQLSGMSIAVVPLHNAQPSSIVDEVLEVCDRLGVSPMPGGAEVEFPEAQKQRS